MILKPKSPKVKRKLLKLSITKQQASDYELIASAYHEAAHTIVGLANLLYVDKVSITINQGGDTDYFVFEADNTKDEWLKRMVLMAEVKTIYAGLVGEKMYYKDICGSINFPSHLKNGSSIDTSMASKLIRKYRLARSGAETFELKQDIRVEVEKLLITHWEAVKTVAHALYRKRKLSFSELKYMLVRTEEKDYWRDKLKKIKTIYEDKNGLCEKVVKNLISSK